MLKNNIWFLSLALLMSFPSCKKDAADSDVPPCLMDKINELSKTACDEGVNVVAYTFQKKTIYVFYQEACTADSTSPVLDASCNTIGVLGGLTGNLIINGEHFRNAVYIKTIWQK